MACLIAHDIEAQGQIKNKAIFNYPEDDSEKEAGIREEKIPVASAANGSLEAPSFKRREQSTLSEGMG